MLQPLEIPEWKWDKVMMNFVSELPKTQQNHDSVWVIVDRLTKDVYFIPINTAYTMDKLA